jgi:hypothetical protein
MCAARQNAGKRHARERRYQLVRRWHAIYLVIQLLWAQTLHTIGSTEFVCVDQLVSLASGA